VDRGSSGNLAHYSALILFVHRIDVARVIGGLWFVHRPPICLQMLSGMLDTSILSEVSVK
jgi:hypothetical protein